MALQQMIDKKFKFSLTFLFIYRQDIFVYLSIFLQFYPRANFVGGTFVE